MIEFCSIFACPLPFPQTISNIQIKIYFRFVLIQQIWREARELALEHVPWVIASGSRCLRTIPCLCVPWFPWEPSPERPSLDVINSFLFMTVGCPFGKPSLAHSQPLAHLLPASPLTASLENSPHRWHFLTPPVEPSP